ncbi:2,5-diketo-D-gluconate reductase [Nitzschia inconspicua]|uniref:2,5-diketo-D-gluconate reductase n=1 Tax=Nitzschia inconspicua TaxID=303405 RepID=A0A9K3Q7E7_9STRA|nr:2,5-diketo-D-gluconate reductase [Nitzschia inconspicua]
MDRRTALVVTTTATRTAATTAGFVGTLASSVLLSTSTTPAVVTLAPSTQEQIQGQGQLSQENVGIVHRVDNRNDGGDGGGDPPSSFLELNNQDGTSPIVSIPRVGYSLFKTSPEQTERCTLLALLSGVVHFDLATQYNNTEQVNTALQKYWHGGRHNVRRHLQQRETPGLLAVMEQTYQRQQQQQRPMNSPFYRFLPNSNYNCDDPISLQKGKNRNRRRKELFLSYKISNEEQSTDPGRVERAIRRVLDALQIDYLDMVSIHSPLTDANTRLETYRTLLELQQQGMIRTVGVCNYGCTPLQEIERAGLSLPVVNQIELSPFNTHSDVVQYCNDHDIAVCCAPWSRLSSIDGPTQQWDVLSKLAQQKQMTKAQVLVRWALQKGYLCVPRSASASKVERMAIAENSYGGVVVNNRPTFRLTTTEMRLLDTLNVNYKAGKLGRKDGWTDSDVTGPEWDPTDAV